MPYSYSRGGRGGGGGRGGRGGSSRRSSGGGGGRGGRTVRNTSRTGGNTSRATTTTATTRNTGAATRAKAKGVANSKLYTSNGSRIRNPAAYQAAGGRVYSSSGAKIYNTNAYQSAIEASVRQNTNHPKYYYHYTTSKSAQQIQQSGIIKASTNGAAGRGTYLTAKTPRCSNTTLLTNNYGSSLRFHPYNSNKSTASSNSNRVESYVRLDADRVRAENYRNELGRDVWKTAGNVNLQANRVDAKFGKRD